MALLDIQGLTVEFGTERAPFKAMNGVDFAIDAREIVGVVGESGSALVSCLVRRNCMPDIYAAVTYAAYAKPGPTGS